MTEVAQVPSQTTDDARHTELSARTVLISRLGLPILIVALLIAGSFISDRFLTSQNLTNLLNGAAIAGIVAVGMTFVVLIGGLADLSVPATVATGAIIVLSLGEELGVVGALVLAVVACAAVGAFNGLLIGYLRLNPIVVTLGVSVVSLGIAQALVQGAIVYIETPDARAVVIARYLGIPFGVWLLLVVVAVAHWVLTRTAWGRSVYAVGGNYSASRSTALPVRRIKATVFVASAAMAGLAGAVLALQLGQARPIIGSGYEFSAITAVVVGGTSILGGVGGVLRTVGGLILIALVTNLLVLSGVPTPAQGMVTGAIIIAAVGLDLRLRRRSGRSE